MSADERLAEIEARAAAATDGPWFRNYNDIVPSASDDDDFCDTRIMRGRHGVPRGDKQAMADADFAAHAREDVPWLLAQVREAWAENERLRKQVQADGEAYLDLLRERDTAWAELRALRERVLGLADEWDDSGYSLYGDLAARDLRAAVVGNEP